MHSKKTQGFTLVELIVVIAIIGLLIVAIANLINSQNTKQQRAIRFAELTEDIITGAKQDMIIWRGSQSGSAPDVTMIPNTYRLVIVSTGSIESKYLPKGETAGNEKNKKIYKRPFLEWDRNYIIEKIQTSSGRIQTNDTLPNWKGWTDTDTLTIQFGNNGTMSLGGSVSFMITIEYEGFRRYVVGDTVSGIITTYRKPIQEETP